MRIAPAIILSPDQWIAWEQHAKSRSLAARVVERARKVLLAAEGRRGPAGQRNRGHPEDDSQEGIELTQAVSHLGMAGLERDAPRPRRMPKINAPLIRRVVNLTTGQKPPNATYWSTRSMVRAVGISEASVRWIWQSHGLKPHRIETFKISNDPEFAEKLQDIVGLYLKRPNTRWCFA